MDFSKRTTYRQVPSAAHQQLFDQIGARSVVADGDLLKIEFSSTTETISDKDRAFIEEFKQQLLGDFQNLKTKLRLLENNSLQIFDQNDNSLFSLGIDGYSEEGLSSDLQNPIALEVILISYDQDVRIASPADLLDIEIASERRFQIIVDQAINAEQHSIDLPSDFAAANPELAKEFSELEAQRSEGEERTIEELEGIKNNAARSGGVLDQEEFENQPMYDTSATPYSAVLSLEHNLVEGKYCVDFYLRKFDSEQHLNLVIPLDPEAMVECKVRREDTFAFGVMTPAHVALLRKYAAILLPKI